MRFATTDDILGRLRHRHLLLALSTSALLCLGGPARADDEGSVYQVRWLPDLAIIGAGAVAWFGPTAFTADLVGTNHHLDRDHVPPFDRFALDRSSKTAGTISNVGVVTMLVLPPLLDVLDVRLHGGAWTSAGEDLLVMGEAVLVNGGLNEVVKLAVRRPRPLAYSEPAGSPALADTDIYLSFYSSHSSTAFAMGTAYASTFALRHPHSGYRFVVYGAVIAGAGTVGLMRVLAGKHFPSDVFTGAAVGSVIGLSVPYLHRRREVVLSAFPGGLSVTGTF
jgi:membrane-associated phospholipid phosphatase